MWLMSPPCQPFTRRGLQLHAADPRSASFQHLLCLMPLLQASSVPCKSSLHMCSCHQISFGNRRGRLPALASAGKLPPCQPFTRRGLQQHAADPGSASFQHLLRLWPLLLARAQGLAHFAFGRHIKSGSSIALKLPGKPLGRHQDGIPASVGSLAISCCVCTVASQGSSRCHLQADFISAACSIPPHTSLWRMSWALRAHPFACSCMTPWLRLA